MSNESPQVKELRQRYQQSLIEKSAVLGEFMQALQNSSEGSLSAEGSSLAEGSAEETVLAIREYLHKLAGSAGMYGYADIAQLARSAMQDVAESDQLSMLDRLSELRHLLEQHA